MYRIATLAVLASIAFAAPANAEGTSPSGGMHYTRMQPEANSDTPTIKTRTINRDETPEAKKEEDTPSTRIWNKYKALAAGESDDKKEDDKKEAEKKETGEEPENKSAESPQTIIEKEPAAPTGIAGIIDEYKRNKAQRSQMRSLTITKPADIKPAAGEEKPAIN